MGARISQKGYLRAYSPEGVRLKKSTTKRVRGNGEVRRATVRVMIRGTGHKSNRGKDEKD